MLKANLWPSFMRVVVVLCGAESPSACAVILSCDTRDSLITGLELLEGVQRKFFVTNKTKIEISAGFLQKVALNEIHVSLIK